MSTAESLKFKVAPHIVEDLGLNLYTTLPRVLVEFIANAYDADSPTAHVVFDIDKIRKAREIVKKQYELEKSEQDADPSKYVAPLETRTLPDDIRIEITDEGHGMSRSDLNAKFLFAGRRRRQEEPDANGRSPNGRPLMGRKGLGKLAGFGVAKVMEVSTRRKGESHATKILLDYDELVKKQSVHEIDVPEETLSDGGGFAESGTKITLSRLLYDPLKSRSRTIEQEIADYLALIDESEFAIYLNGAVVRPAPRTLAYAWPQPDDLAVEEFVEMQLPREGGGEITFRYRIRFTGKNEALAAEQRGVRVYAHKRLAAAPSLLSADTNMHGFRMTDYLDGVVHADFIDEEEADYISTDRESLRWESPLLSGLYEFLGKEITEACKQYAKKREEDAPKIVQSDPFTCGEVNRHDFSKKDRKLAFRFAEILEKTYKRGIDDPAYKNTLPPLLNGIGHGNILTAITALAEQSQPELDRVVHEIVRLTKDEFDQFVGSVKGRLKGIVALYKIVEHPDFKAKRNEKKIQELMEECPWLVDPTYTQFLLTADVSLGTVFKRLAQELQIGKYAPTKADGKEPDLVFLIGNLSLHRVVIVELKASNVPLDADNLGQLEYYMQRTEEWLESENLPGFKVLGHLIGTKASPSSRAQGAVVLRRRIKEAGPDTPWRVRDYLEVLEDTKAAHEELMAIDQKLEAEAEAEADNA